MSVNTIRKLKSDLSGLRWISGKGEENLISGTLCPEPMFYIINTCIQDFDMVSSDPKSMVSGCFLYHGIDL